MNLEQRFSVYRDNVVGNGQVFRTPYGEVRMLYADWTASGRLYRPIEQAMLEQVGPYVGNTHSESSETGMAMTRLYHQAHQLLKRHVNAGLNDVIITAEAGMTGVVNKLQRIMGLRICERMKPFLRLPEDDRPVVFVTHMEHHSNHISWRETCADVVCLEPGPDGLIDLNRLEHQLQRYRGRRLKIGAFTACSNVTGIVTPYHAMAKLMHQHDGLCFVDFAASAPYVDIDMHPADPLAYLDAVYFSPHKFLGGPGSSGVLIFNRNIHDNAIPDNPGGGTVDWTSPWGHKYIHDIELREDGGTPGFLQAIRAALSVQLKEKMSSDLMLAREHELLRRLFSGLDTIPSLHILEGEMRERLGIVSVYVDGIHYNLLVKVLNDRFGIQVRGGCSCAGTYGHYLLGVGREQSAKITNNIDKGDLSAKPGWVRVSLHPVTTDSEIECIVAAFKQTVANIDRLRGDYLYDGRTNEFRHRGESPTKPAAWLRL